MRLPRDTDALTGLRAARWIRESTAAQQDRFGPDAQREQQDRAIERYGLVDSGVEWTVAHSGRTVSTTPAFADMLDRAGRDFDVLVVGYVSRFARDVRTIVNARHDLHRAGAVILFCDERVLSSDEDSWETFAREAVEAEAYSRRLGKRIREGYAAKFRRHADPGGRPPLGFHRVPPASTLAIDPDTIGRAVALFERYAAGSASIDDLARESGMVDRTVNDILRNPLYNGWVMRKGERSPAAWRDRPPVSDMVWDRVQALMARRTRGGGPPAPDRVDMLRGLLRCECGARIRANGTNSAGTRQKLHAGDCPAGHRRHYLAETWEPYIAEQVRGIRHDDATVAKVVSALAVPEDAPASLDVARLDRQRRDLALDHAAGRLDDDDYLAAVAALRRAQRVAEVTPAPVVDSATAVRYVRSLADLWDALTDAERAELIQAIYDEVTVAGDTFVSVRLTPHAYAHGLALALPESVRARDRARPTGVGRAVSSVRIPIEGRAEWRAAARRSA